MTAMKSTNITWHKPLVTQEDRDERNGYKGVVLWFTGLPSSGKSTLAHQLERSLFERGCNAYVLDGDNIRHRLNKDLSFTPEDRTENIRRIGEVANLFADGGIIVRDQGYGLHLEILTMQCASVRVRQPGACATEVAGDLCSNEDELATGLAAVACGRPEIDIAANRNRSPT